MLKMNLEYNAGVLIINLDGELNGKTSYKINNFLHPFLYRHHIKKVIYNCENLNSIDYDGINTLKRTKDIINGYQGKIYFSKVHKGIYLKLKSLHIELIS